MGMRNPDSQIDHLSDFPKVRDWWSVRQHRLPTLEHAAEFHLAFLAKALRMPGTTRCNYWANAVIQLTTNVDPFLDHILETDALTNSLGTSLTDIYGKLAELALADEDGAVALKALQTLAARTELAAFRFLAAFTAFNMNDYETCVQECESVTEPFGPIHTLLGQAFLESGRPAEAIDALKVANSVSPSDPLPLVQLIKAYLVTGIQGEAMKCVDKCRKILGHHIEVECLAAMTIMAGPHRNDDFIGRTYQSLERHMNEFPDDIEAYAVAMELSSELQDKTRARNFTRQLEVSKSTNPQRLALRVAEVLKRAGELQWYEITRELIDKAIPATRGVPGSFTQ